MMTSIKNIAKKLLRIGHQSTAIFDRSFLSQKIPLHADPVFVVGVPRSGTTLVYQLMTQAFRFAYLPNAANTFYQCPIFATKMARMFAGEYQSSFTSRYGHEKGWIAPSEAGNVWNRWFPHENIQGYNYTPAGYLSSDARREIFALVAHLSEIFKAPFITKNVKMSVRLPAIFEIFPDARIVHIKRDPLDSALSILKIRRKRGGAWWSVQPKEIVDIINLPDIEQVVMQVMLVEQNIENDIQAFGSQQRRVIQYEALCNAPHQTLTEIGQFLRLSASASLADIPAQFPVSKPDIQPVISPEDAQAVERLLKKRFSDIRDEH